jgi:SAM-dependent methyltransferase
MIVDLESDLKHYETLYGQHVPGGPRCPVSIDNLAKARQRVHQVLRAFGLKSRIPGARVLDVGCGLGYIAEAFRLEGATAVGIDMSPMAITRARGLFPEVEFRCQAFPRGGGGDEKFDLIWVLDISTLNTFDVAEMQANVINPALELLALNGTLIIGWHSNFSGQAIRDFCQWSFKTIWELQAQASLSGPRVAQVRYGGLSWMTIGVCRILKKSCPIFFIGRGKSRVL